MLRIALVAAVVPMATAALSAAWTLEKGRTQTMVTSTFTYGDHGFDKDGKLVTVPEYRKFELTGVMEYGVRPWLTAIGRAQIEQETFDTYVPEAGYATTTEAQGSIGGGARIRLLNGQVGPAGYVVSTEATVSSGEMDTAGLAGASEGAEIDVRGLVGVSAEAWGRPVFADLQVGYVKRFDDSEDDEVKIDATLGAKITPKWMVLAQSFSTVSVGGAQNYHKLSASVVRQVSPRLRLEVGAFRTMAGQDALQETGGRLGFWWNF